MTSDKPKPRRPPLAQPPPMPEVLYVRPNTTGRRTVRAHEEGKRTEQRKEQRHEP